MVPGLAAASEEYMEEVVVTAQKREEAVTDVPISVQVTSGDYLDEQSVKNLREFVNFVPGMTQKASFSNAHPDFQLRSITQTAGDEDIGGWIDLQLHAINFATFAYEPVGDPIENYGGTDISDYRLQVLAEPNERLSLKVTAIM